MARKYFGTDGIRGRANGVITPELALKVGQAVGLIFQNGDHRHRVLIGKDTRLSGYMIENALTAGFTSVGMDVLLTGPIPTPGVAMLTRSMRADLGVMISASHNPLRRQRHQAVRPGRLQAVRRDREADRGTDRLRPGQAARQLAEDRPRQAHRRRAGPLHRVRQAHAAAHHGTGRHARRDRLRQRRRLPRRAGGAVGARRGGVLASASSRTASTSTRSAARPRPPRSPPRCARCAPTSASRSTATPTAS